MTPTGPQLDELIDEITVDCYSDDEALVGFENAFDEADGLPCPASVIGEDVELISVAAPGCRRELVATCRRGGRRHTVALLDVTVPIDHPVTTLVAAYRRWHAP